MRTLLRNFFYAVGFVLIAFLYTSNPDDLRLSDLARLVQDPFTHFLAVALTVVITLCEWLWGVLYSLLTQTRSDLISLAKLAASAAVFAWNRRRTIAEGNLENLPSSWPRK